MGKKAAGGKRVAAAPLAEKKKKLVKTNNLFVSTPRDFKNFGSGDLQPKRDVTRYVRWPKFVRLQRMKKILMQRLKVPPAINQFNMAIDKNQASQVLRLFGKYRPETKIAKRARLMETAKQKKEGNEVKTKKPMHIKFGLNHVTTLIEEKQAKLVVIAHDCDPVELVCWMPTLCRKKDVPYCIMKSKGRLGALVHQKKATCIALTAVRPEDKSELDTLITNFKAQFNDNIDARRTWGGRTMGTKAQHAAAKKAKSHQMEQAKKLGLHIG